MNNVSFSVALFVVALVGAVVGYLAYNSAYGGLKYRLNKVSLTNAQKGEVYNFTYCQPLSGKRERYLARVENVNLLTAQQISRLNTHSNYRANDPSFERSSTLVTVRTYDGQIRNVYAERCVNVRKPYLGQKLFGMPKVAAYLL
jgi:hypothetical protein